MNSPFFGFVDAAIRLFGYERGDNGTGGVPRSSTRFGYRLIIDGPIVVADFESSKANSEYYADRIIGGHIRDALIQSFSATNNRMTDSFYDNVVFSDALWITSDSPFRPVPMPLSVAVAKVGTDICVVDTTECADAEFIAINGEARVLTMEQFENLQQTEHVGHLIYRPSWKDQHKEAAEQVFSKVWKVPSAEAQRLKLAASIAKRLRQLQSKQSELSHQQVWLGDIDLSGVEEPQRAQVLKRLKLMLHSDGIRLGKSKTPVKFELCEDPHKATVTLPQATEMIKILLVSAASILPATVAAGGTNSFTRLKEYYENYFRYASNDLLQLSTYYASQRMAGGVEYQRHFGKHVHHYRPELLTEEGSVFLLRRNAAATDAEILQLMQNWSDRGLPNAEDRASYTWRNHPFVRENGYSDVWVNYPAMSAQAAIVGHGQAL